MHNPFENWMKPEFISNFTPASTIPGMANVKDIMESGRRSIQAYAEAQQVAMESMQTIIQRQTEILSQLVQDNSTIAQEIINEGTPEDKVARGAELIRSTYEKTVSGIQEVNDICSKSTKEACDIINRRVSACLEEVQCTAKENIKGKKAPSKKSA
ncbi:MAG: TIGR01841 family phasin [Alphaproteobacteria bacterium]|nr:TIGR01841 family phasin [Alphaproteobacteria bacterium]OIN86621.1 MAG: hypothetical protein AUJ12_04905 [Alphaproteobacteria bacterium CG1_02_46_17]